MLMSNNARAQGFAIVEAVLAGTEVAELARILETSDLDRSRAGARHLMNHPAVSAVAADPRMLAIAAQFLGDTAIPYKATLFDKSPARNWLVAWHQDTALPLSERREIWRARSIHGDDGFPSENLVPSGVRGRPRPASPTRSRPPPPWRRWWLCACIWMIRVQTTGRCVCFPGRTRSAC
jgi:hypothetical protein